MVDDGVTILSVAVMCCVRGFRRARKARDDDPLADYDAISIGVNFDRPPDRAGLTEYLLLSKLTM